MVTFLVLWRLSRGKVYIKLVRRRSFWRAHGACSITNPNSTNGGLKCSGKDLKKQKQFFLPTGRLQVENNQKVTHVTKRIFWNFGFNVKMKQCKLRLIENGSSYMNLSQCKSHAIKNSKINLQELLSRWSLQRTIKET